MSDPVAQSVREALKRWYELIDSAHAVGDPELAADLQQRIDSALTQAVTDNAIRKRQPRCTH